MKTAYYIKLSDTALAVLDLIPYMELGMIITRISVPRKHRRQGVGTDLLKMAMAEADDEGIDLWLMPMASGGDVGPNDDELAAWYKRYDFWFTSRGIMQRKARDRR